MTRGTRLPEFITFTGVDDRTDMARARRIEAAYPVEFAVLYSIKKSGHEQRYPYGDVAMRWAHSGIRLAVHLCGVAAYAGAIPEWAAAPSGPVDRVQLNGVGLWEARNHGVRAAKQTIAQVHDFCVAVPHVHRLFDLSGGRGTQPNRWPRHPGHGELVGYAGGITPENVSATIEAIAADGPYWIDMESGVRTDDWFDLAKCEAVCRAVYGEAHHGG